MVCHANLTCAADARGVTGMPTTPNMSLTPTPARALAAISYPSWMPAGGMMLAARGARFVAALLLLLVDAVAAGADCGVMNAVTM